VNRLFLIAAFQSLLVAAPVVTALRPPGAQQGKSFVLTLSGRDLPEGAKLVTTLPAAFTPLTPTAKGLPFLVELKRDAPVGIYPIRVETTTGISNVLLFSVGAFPEIEEEEMGTAHTNDSIADAQIVAETPVTINGSLSGADRDTFRVHVKAGEHRVFEVEARRCGSAIDPVLELYDEKGKTLARNEDAPGIGVDSRLEYTFTRDGNYYVEVHDARFSKQEQNFYRLLIGSYRYPESIFPLGGKRGQALEVEFVTKAGPVHTTVNLPAKGDFADVAMPGSPVLPFRLALGDYPEIVGPVGDFLPVPVIANGKIGKPGEVHRYRLRATPGESFLLELQSRELETSRLDALITVYDSQGKKLASAGDTPPPVDVFSVNAVGRTSGDPFLNFKVPENTTEITVAVEDIARRGGADFGYRLTVRKQAEEFRLSASPAYINVPRGGTVMLVVNADRRGYDGPIQASIRGLPKGWTANGGYIAAETIDPSNQRSFNRRGIMTITADPDAEPLRHDLVIEGEAKLEDGSILRRTATGSGSVTDIANGTGLPDASSTDRQKPFTAAWLDMDMPASITSEPVATVEVKSTGHTQMAEGDAYRFEWKIATKRKDLTMPSSVNADAPGVRDIRVIDMKADAKGAPSGTFTITTTRATTPVVYDLVISANMMVDGKREQIISRAIPFEVLKGASSENATKATSGNR
jgi:Bacterial pre-peptidase C-terminal domain